MAVENYAGAILGKGTLAVLGKVSATTFVLTLGVAVAVVVAVAAGAMLVAQMVNFEILDSEISDEAKRIS